jgi:hypothetical protein
MNAVTGSPVPLSGATSSATVPEVSLFRLYLLRAAYLLLVVGLGVNVWPTVINHTSELAVTHGPRFALLAGIGATALLGLRYPLQMLPLLLFELIWKLIYLTAFALPLWAANQIDAVTAENITNCLFVVIFIPLIPWRYVVAHYVMKRGDRWK